MLDKKGLPRFWGSLFWVVMGTGENKNQSRLLRPFYSTIIFPTPSTFPPSSNPYIYIPGERPCTERANFCPEMPCFRITVFPCKSNTVRLPCWRVSPHAKFTRSWLGLGHTLRSVVSSSPGVIVVEGLASVFTVVLVVMGALKSKKM